MEVLNDLQEQIVGYYDQFIVLLPKVALAIVVCALLFVILGFFRRRIIKYARLKAEDQLLINFFDGAINIAIVILIFLVFLYIIGMAAIAGSALGAVGVSTFIIGFAFKDIAENFLAGVIMAFKRPFRIGDYIKSNDVEGSILEMNLRDTHIKTVDGKDVYVPNGQILKNPLYNYTIDGYLRGSFIVGVDYESDIEEAREIILREIMNIEGILKEDKLPRTHVKNLNTSTVDIEVFYWINTFDDKFSGLELKSIAQSKVVAALTEANIGMPADIVELKNYDDGLSLKERKMLEN
ncbi:mechanosensitive ion channel family protein [Portibacter marinus]|uniref:mechanosensitive ion channel family protein n=1 Tax=Portibacter marinus TaxID=2898660 RepID=UPI001F254278|nr:mechanosensitive ion channel family protein [Portibacter marinus]